MPVEDYYSLIGVAADADRDAIKDAYRARRAELDDSEAGRANAAKLNRAWNILGDPQQRERYDDDLATAHLDDDVIIPELVGSSRPATGSKAQQRRAAAKAKQGDRPVRPIREQESEVNGIPLAASRDRVFALVIDIFIVFLIFSYGSQIMAQSLADSRAKQEVAAVDALSASLDAQKQIADTASKEASKTKTVLDEAKAGTDTQRIADAEKANSAAKAKKDAAATEFRKQEKNYFKERENLILPYVRVSYVALGALLLVIFVVPSALWGRSPGKAARKLRLANLDGSPCGWRGAIKHYGLVIGALVISGVAITLYAQLFWIVVLFGVSSFTRSPTRQGWHDRIAKTRVVEG